MITKVVTTHILRCTEVYKLEDRYGVMLMDNVGSAAVI